MPQVRELPTSKTISTGIARLISSERLEIILIRGISISSPNIAKIFK